MSKSLFEQLGGTYREEDGLLYPKSEMPEEKAIDVGKYGHLWLDYLRENHPGRYLHLRIHGGLNEKAAEVNDEAYDLLNQMMEKYLAKNQPKNPNSTMEMWRIREQAKMQAEEIVLRDCVYQLFKDGEK